MPDIERSGIPGVRIEPGVYGERAVVVSPWSDQIAGYIISHQIVELELNQGNGWSGKDISFLKQLGHLRLFKIIDFNISSIASIHYLHKLKALEILTYCDTEVNFSQFPLLYECALEWRPGAKSIFECSGLGRLFVNNFDCTGVESFGRLVSLESLALLNAPLESIVGLRPLIHLKALRLANLRRLVSLSGLECLTNLKELEINTCPKIHSIDEMAALAELRILNLNNDGPIRSLSPLRNLKALEMVNFYESTNIVDGDLSPLVRAEHPLKVSFRNRRHYSCKREDPSFV